MIDDVAALIREGRGAYDAILLDVDNGPAPFTAPANAGDGDVLVRIPGTGGDKLSNPFPVDVP